MHQTQPTTKGDRVESRRLSTSSGGGFTLIELVLVVVTVGLLASLVVPILVRGKENARSTHCRNNLRQIGIAARLYAEDNRETYFCLPGGLFIFGGEWTAGPSSTALRSTSDRQGYWGLGYYPYVAGNRKVFGCPNGTVVDDYRDQGYHYDHDYKANST